MILRTDQFSEEELNDGYKELVFAFNRTHDSKGSDIDQMTYMDFYRFNEHSHIEPYRWLEFLSDHRVILILDKILLMNMRSNVNKILSSEDKSVAASQKLSASLNFLDKHFDSVMSRETTQYIYTSIPLTKFEEQSQNARTLVIEPSKNPHNPRKGDK